MADLEETESAGKPAGCESEDSMRSPTDPIRLVLVAVAAGAFLAGASLAAKPSPVWESLEGGLELGTFEGPHQSSHGDSKIRVLRIDPARFELKLLNASAPGEGESRTVRAWVTRAGAVAGINPSMFHHGGSSVSLMRTRTHVNNKNLSKDNSILAFDPLSPGLPPVRILDRTCENTTALMGSYGSLVQSIRMIDCDGKTTWAKQDRKWSNAAIGLDREGRVLFIHARSPYPVRDFVDRLRELPLDLVRLQYSEGGPEATLYVAAGGRELELVGSYETGFNENDDNTSAWPVPNVVVAVPKEP